MLPGRRAFRLKCSVPEVETKKYECLGRVFSLRWLKDRLGNRFFQAFVGIICRAAFKHHSDRNFSEIE